MVKKWVFMLIVSGFFCASIGAWEKDNFSLNIYLNRETGGHLDNPSKLMKVYNSLQLKGSYDFNEDISLFFNLKKFYDGVYDRAGQYKNGSYKTATNTGNTWLREIFLDFDHGPYFLRFGRQQVVWGTADGVRVLDCINPADSRYAYLDDASEYRIPLWMFRFEISPVTDGNLQFLLIPDYEPNFSAGYGDVFVYRVANRPPAGPPIVTVWDDRRRDDGFSDAMYALRWHHVVNGWEYTLNYKYGFEYYPSVTSTMVFPVLTLIKEYQRVNVFGASFSKAINEGKFEGVTVRGELVYTKDKPFPYIDGGGNYHATTMNTFAYVLGFDKYLFTDLLTSFQFIQFIYPENKVGANDILFPPTLSPLDKIETMATLKLAKNFMAERLKPEILIVYDGSGDWRISPKVKYEMNDHLWIYGGIHFFAGKGDTLYGEFEQDSMAFVGATLSF